MSKNLPNTDDYEIQPSSVAKILKENAGSIRILDCREEDEFQICRIEGAELIPLSRFAELAPVMLKDTDKPLVIY